MGLTRVTVRVSELSGNGDPYEADFLVDTGAIHSMAPEARLVEAGIKPEGKAVYQVANGQAVEYRYGFARIAFMGDETVGRILFGPSEVGPILGVMALESVGIMVDPVGKTLRRLPTLPLL